MSLSLSSQNQRCDARVCGRFGKSLQKSTIVHLIALNVILDIDGTENFIILLCLCLHEPITDL